MSLSQCRAFIKTIELGNLTRAAESLGYTQSGITHLLNSLETECGMKLLVREKSGAYPTADGEQLKPYIEEITQAYDNFEKKLSEIRNLETGLIRVATFTSVSVQWLPGIIANFEQDHPQVQFELMHDIDGTSAEWLRTGKVDCAFVSTNDALDFPTYELHKDPIVAVVPEDHPLAAEDEIAIEDLAEYPYIRLDDGTFREAGEISEIFHKHNVTPKVRFSEMNDYAVVAMVEQGLGVTILPQMIVYKTSRKIAVKPLKSSEERTLGLAVKNPEQLPLSTREFIRYTQDWVKKKYSDD